MHETSIVSALLDQIDAQARAHGAAAVRRVELSLGEMSGVEPELLEIAFRTYREGTVCAEAELTLRRVPVRWECERCGHTPERGGFLQCPHCKGPAKLVQGDEITLDRLEMEVPDVS